MLVLQCVTLRFVWLVGWWTIKIVTRTSITNHVPAAADTNYREKPRITPTSRIKSHQTLNVNIMPQWNPANFNRTAIKLLVNHHN